MAGAWKVALPAASAVRTKPAVVAVPTCSVVTDSAPNVVAPVTPSVPAIVWLPALVMPPVVSVPLIVALFVTVRAVPAAENVLALLRYGTLVSVPEVLISTPLSWMAAPAPVALTIVPCTVPDAVTDVPPESAPFSVIVVAPRILPAFVMPPALLLMPPDIDAAAPSVDKPPATLNVFTPVTVVLPLSEIAPVVVAKVPEPLKATVGLLVALPKTSEVAVVPPIVMAAAEPVSMLTPFVKPALAMVSAPLLTRLGVVTLVVKLGAFVMLIAPQAVPLVPSVTVVPPPLRFPDPLAQLNVLAPAAAWLAAAP